MPVRVERLHQGLTHCGNCARRRHHNRQRTAGRRVSERMWPLGRYNIASCRVLVSICCTFQAQHHLRRLHTLLRITGTVISQRAR